MENLSYSDLGEGNVYYLSSLLGVMGGAGGGGDSNNTGKLFEFKLYRRAFKFFGVNV